MKYNGIVVVNARNASFNAGFDGLPRRLPDGSIFATDKALKYCLREYLSEREPIFVQRTKKFHETKDGMKQKFLTLEENYCEKCGKEKVPKSDEEVISDLKRFIDVRLFGVVFAVANSNVSIIGPCQINYGINRFKESNIFSSQILSPYKNSNEKSVDKQQTTIGEESRVDNVYYVYDVCLNMDSASKQGIEITDHDIEELKNALKHSVGEATSATMFGCETVSMIWFENKKDEIFNNLNTLVNIYEKNGEMIVDYSKVTELTNGKINEGSMDQYANKVKNIFEA